MISELGHSTASTLCIGRTKRSPHRCHAARASRIVEATGGPTRSAESRPPIGHAVDGGAVSRLPQFILILSTVLGSWLGMQLVHEFGHVLGAWLTGGRVARVVFHPLTISRTDLAHNPNPLAVVWAGPLFGVTAPLCLWAFAAAVRRTWTFVLRFSQASAFWQTERTLVWVHSTGWATVARCCDTVQALWQLWSSHAVTALVGLWLWNNHQGPHLWTRDGKGAGQL